MAGIITTNNHPQALWPGVHAWFGRVYNEWDPAFTHLFEKKTSDKNYEMYVGATGFGPAVIKSQSNSVSYDTESQGFTVRLTNVSYGLGYQVTHEEMQDDLYEIVSKRRAWALSRSMRETKEINGANIYNRAFNSTYVGGDGVSLCSTAHPLVYGGTLANKPTTDADLSEASLEDSIIAIKGFTNDRGLQINLRPMSLHYPRQELFNQERILKSNKQSGTANNDLNAIREMGYLPKGSFVNVWFTSPHAWFIRTDLTEAGLIYQEREALSFTQDNDFDTMNAKAKCFERYAFGWADWRSIYGVNGP